jgi:ElaB/YqjD/DUF883 family membrane-anchored ribosome-binding protein
MAEIRIDGEGGDDRTLLQGRAPGPVGGLPEARPLGAADGPGTRDVPETISARPVTDPDHLLPEHAGRGVPGTVAATDDPDVVRGEIERTRARMSSTIDTIETVLLRKKERLEEKLDVTAPVRRVVRDNPWPVVGGVFGAGLLLGYLTGGGDKEHHAPPRQLHGDTDGGGTVPGGFGVEAGETYGADWRERSLQWERRARTLMKTCHRQDEEIRHLRSAIGAADVDEGESEGGGWTSAVAQTVSGFVSNLFGGRGGGEREYVVELEEEYVVDLEEPRGEYRTTGGEYGTSGNPYGATGESGREYGGGTPGGGYGPGNPGGGW